MIFIGDRPALQCALVTGGSLTYTGDKLTPFQVYARVESYTKHLITRASAHGHYPAIPPHILLSTGLMWASRYDGMIVRQLDKLLSEAFVTPRIYVLGVSSRLATGHDINQRIEKRCAPRSTHRATGMLRDNVRFIGGFNASAEEPTVPTPSEALGIVERINP